MWQFYYKLRHLLRKCHNFITKCYSYYKMRRSLMCRYTAYHVSICCLFAFLHFTSKIPVSQNWTKMRQARSYSVISLQNTTVLEVFTLRNICNNRCTTFTFLLSIWTTKSLTWCNFCFKNFENFSGYAASNINCVIYRTLNSIKRISIQLNLQLPMHFYFFYVSVYAFLLFEFCQTGTSISLLVPHLIPSNSSRIKGFFNYFQVSLDVHTTITDHAQYVNRC